MVTITLPRAQGKIGPQGPQGPVGPVGPQGEVSRAELTAATSPLATRDGSNVEADAFRGAIGADLSGNVNFTPEGAGAITRTVQSKLRDTVSPKDFGAVGNGIADDTAALRKWLLADATVHELGGEGQVYLVSPTSPEGAILPMESARHIIGRGAVIKVVDGVGPFTMLMGSTSSDLSDTLVEGVIFDCNGNNGTGYSVTSNVLDHPRFTFCARVGNNIRLRNNVVRDSVCTNSFYLNGSAGAGNCLVSSPEITGNSWFNVGSNAAPEHDHSTIYTNENNGLISNNYAAARAQNVHGSACFVETHGTGTRVYGNEGIDFRGLANITGVRSAGDSDRIQVSGNKCRCVQWGIRLFSLSVPFHTTGFGLSNTDVFDNQIRINQTNLPAGSSSFYIGVGMQPGATLGVKNLRIYNNHVVYDDESSASSYSALNPAVGVGETSGTQVFENVQIWGNTVVNAPASAIALGFGGGVFKNCMIGPNTIINPGAGLNPAVASAVHKCAIYLGGHSYLGSLSVGRQSIVDNYETTRMALGAYATPITDSSACEFKIDLSIVLGGSVKTAFLRPYSGGNDFIVPRLEATTNRTPNFNTRLFKAGSSIRDVSTDLTYKTQIAGSTWTSHGFSASAPVSGAHNAGSTRLNPAPTAGGNIGVVCVASGSPGTWKSYGAISA